MRPARLAAVLTPLAILTGCESPPTDVGRVDLDPFADRATAPIHLPLDTRWVPPEAAEPSFDPPLDDVSVRLPMSDVVSLDLRDTRLAEAVHMIARIAGVNILLDAGIDRPVDASFPNIPLDEALEVLLGRQGLVLDKTGPDVYFVRASDESVPTTALFPLTGARADAVAANLALLLGEDVPMTTDPTRNVVVLTAPRALVRRAAAFVEAVDRPRPQVLIEVGIYEASIEDDFELGLSHDVAKTIDGRTFGLLQAFRTPDEQFSMTFDSSGGTVSSTIQALRAHVNVELVSSPRVMVASTSEARVEVIEQVPYVDVTATTTGTTAGIGSTVQEQVVFKEAGVTLVVTPVIQDDGLVEVNVDQTVSEVVDFFNEIPVIDERQLVTSFLVADGQTVVLGGLMQDRRIENEDGVPLLAKIPGVGLLFKKQEDRTEKRELLVFLTPRILDPEQARAVADAYRDHYRQERLEMGLTPIGEEPWR